MALRLPSARTRVWARGLLPRQRPLLIAGSLSLLLSAAGSHAENPSPGGLTPPAPVSFKSQIQPIFDANCVVCHQSGGAQEGLILEDGKAYANLIGKLSRQADMLLVSPGSFEASYLFHKIAGTHVATHGRGARMPLGGQLDARDIDVVRDWILAGAKDN